MLRKIVDRLLMMGATRTGHQPVINGVGYKRNGVRGRAYGLGNVGRVVHPDQGSRIKDRLDSNTAESVSSLKWHVDL